jgi:hypothetical protein
LYKLESKRLLKYIFQISANCWFKQGYVLSKIKPYIDMSNGKKRLIEVPNEELKQIQKRLKGLLATLPVPEYVFSGVKGRSYIGNAQFHLGQKFLFKIDMKAFFPNTAREKVYIFFRNKLLVAPDIAEILTNWTTIDLDKLDALEIQEVNDFIISKGIKARNHLISGSPSSPILSYFASEDMFNKLDEISKENKMIMTIYVDDVVFSSETKISHKVRTKILNIIKEYGYQTSKGKVRYYHRLLPKKVTGVIINANGDFSVPNVLQHKIITNLRLLKNQNHEEGIKKSLVGQLIAARQIEKNAFPSIRKYINDLK